MPEGDTVWRTCRTLDRALTGQVATLDLRVPSLATVSLTARITGTLARGKHLLTRFESGQTLHTHLRMEGSWHLYRPGEPWGRPGHQARVVIDTGPWQAVGFSLGVVELVTDEQTAVGHLGPDLLGPDWDPDLALANLRSDPTVPIADALLDQRNLAGIGNIYKNELCFLTGVDPRTPVGEVDALPRMIARAAALLGANKERIEQTTTGDTRRGRRTWVQGRAGQPCRRCGETIRSGEQGPVGRERITYWCPRCQPLPP